jgi:hypothetical protein
VDTVTRDGAALVFTGSETMLRFSPLPRIPEAALLGESWELDTMIDGDASGSASRSSLERL